jgi:uncharacterized protein (DUF427 family)
MADTNRGRVRVEDGHKRVRVYLGGELVADTLNPKYVWEKPYYPTYYFPPSDVQTGLFVDTGETYRSPSRGTASVHTVKVGREQAVAAARVWDEAEIEELAGFVSFNWSSMSNWFEEDEEVYVHPRDPYSRVDILQSSRHIEVIVDGVKVADTHQPRLLFETGLPVRYYIPKTDVALELLEASDLHTACPYKGTADYWNVRTPGGLVENIVWGYPTPLPESNGIGGYVSFYNEKVDIVVDGELQDRPKTHFS